MNILIDSVQPYRREWSHPFLWQSQ